MTRADKLDLAGLLERRRRAGNRLLAVLGVTLAVQVGRVGVARRDGARDC